MGYLTSMYTHSPMPNVNFQALGRSNNNLHLLHCVVGYITSWGPCVVGIYYVDKIYHGRSVFLSLLFSVVETVADKLLLHHLASMQPMDTILFGATIPCCHLQWPPMYKTHSHQHQPDGIVNKGRISGLVQDCLGILAIHDKPMWATASW